MAENQLIKPDWLPGQWWCTLVILALKRIRQEGGVVEASLGNIVRDNLQNVIWNPRRGLPLLWWDTVTKATLIRITFNWGCLTGSEVQSIIIKVGTWHHPDRHGTGRAESSTSSSKGC